MPTISQSVREQLPENELNSGYLMLQRLKVRYAEQIFMYAIRKLLTLRPSEFGSFESWITYKVMNERIDAINIQFKADERTLLMITSGLQSRPEYYLRVRVKSCYEELYKRLCNHKLS